MKYLSVEMPDVRRDSALGTSKSIIPWFYPCSSSNIYLQHLWKYTLMGHLLVVWALRIIPQVSQRLGVTPLPRVLVRTGEQEMRLPRADSAFCVSKISTDPSERFGCSSQAARSPGSASQITKAVRDTTVLIKLVLKAKAREWERRWKLSRSGSLSIANLLLIRAALMHNKESQEKTPKAQDCTILRWIKTNPWQWHLKNYFILVKSCLCLDTCTHPPVANEDLRSGSKTWVTHLCVCVSVYQR